MRTGLLFLFWLLAFIPSLNSQKKCEAVQYTQNRLSQNIELADRQDQIEHLISRALADRQGTAARGEETIIRIPVVVHILYHHPSEKITDAQVLSQIQVLNKCFRRRNADSVKTPSYFRPVAADCGIEFQLAISDPRRRSTTGIIRKYTPVKEWVADDKMKYSSEMGDDAWDPKSYLNIWVCNLRQVAGYASIPGDELSKDGIVIGFPAFGTSASQTGYEMGKTAVHEVGHWLNLKHIWGDQYCGDDKVDDTPRQAGYNIGCPGVINITCGNGPNGDMYMNYMDLTSDACMNIFTQGQKARMRALFENGGPRQGILTSKGLNLPLISEIPVPETDPTWLHPQLYPNPASSVLTLDLTYDTRWMGKTIRVMNMAGQVVMNLTINSKILQLNISSLPAGIYLLAAKKDDGESMKLRFVKR